MPEYKLLNTTGFLGNKIYRVLNNQNKREGKRLALGSGEAQCKRMTCILPRRYNTAVRLVRAAQVVLTGGGSTGLALWHGRGRAVALPKKNIGAEKRN